jgi:hypothetical protein
MSELLKDKILAFALKAHIDLRKKNRADEFIYEDELKHRFPADAYEVHDLLNLLSHPLSKTKYLTKHTNGGYVINEEGIKFCEGGYTKGEEARITRTWKDALSFNLTTTERPLWQVVLVITCLLLAIAAVIIPVMLYMSES